jgi:hypothetical protein
VEEMKKAILISFAALLSIAQGQVVYKGPPPGMTLIITAHLAYICGYKEGTGKILPSEESICADVRKDLGLTLQDIR